MSANARVEKYDNRVDWLRARKTGIGASEMAAVMGISPYASPYSVWADKVTDEIDDRPPTGRQYWGLKHEPMIAEEFAARTGLEVWDPGPYTIYRDAEQPYLFATPDRLIRHPDGRISPLECKKVSLDQWHKWDECPPAHILIQVCQQVLVLNAHTGDLAVLIGDEEYRTYPVPRDDAMIADIRAAAARFWDLVERREPPEIDGHPATTEAIKRLYNEADGETEIELPPTADRDGERLLEIEEQIKALQDAQGKLKEEAAKIENVLRAAIGEATFGRGRNTLWSLKTTNRKGVLRVEPEHATALERNAIPYKETEPTSYRTLRHKTVKETKS